MLTDDYRVRLEAFEGPLDLLLHLIRKSEVEITDIPISTIAQQYMEFLKGIERIDIEVAGEFLVMAATLTEIKSRMLSATPEQHSAALEAGGPQEDPRSELVRQLLAYKQYRDAAGELEHRAEEWSHRFPAARAGIDNEQVRAALDEMGEVDLGDITLTDLAQAFQKIIETVNFDRLGDHKVTYDDTPIELHAADIVDRLQRDVGHEGEMALQSVFTTRTRSEMIGLFLAVLDLVRRNRVAVRQDRVGGQIFLKLRDESDQLQYGVQGEAASQSPGTDSPSA